MIDIDVKGEIYEGLLQKNAEDIKSGAGQYFTPRPLIKAMVDVIPGPGATICDPACGTGGFILASHDYISKHFSLDIEQKKALRSKTFKGWEIVDNAARLCVMNLYLHGIGGEESPIIVADALASDPGDRFDVVLTNPPFGKKSSYTIVNGEGKADKDSQTYERQDFWATTSNKQLNFLQHVKNLLKLWIYDLRTNQHFTLKTNTLKYEDMADFIKCYNPDNRFERKESERLRGFTYDELMQRDKVSLDIFWLKDDSLEDSANLPDPDIIAKDIAENLEDALEQFRSIQEDLKI